MGLWISILLLLIVVVLWQVYTQIEAFSSRGSNDFVPRNCESARQEYLSANADVRGAGVDPWTHWNQYGKNEGRPWPRCTEAPPTAGSASGSATAATAPAPAPATAAAPATTSVAATTASNAAQDASGSVLSTTRRGISFSPEEIMAALAGTTTVASTPAASAAPAPSAAMTKEIEERLAKRISTQIKSELLSQRATEHPVDNKYAACELSPSDAEAQGAEYTQAKPGFNINDYVRKDSIPCWACSLPPA